MTIRSILTHVPPKKNRVRSGFSSALQSVRMVIWPFFMTLPALVLYHICYLLDWHRSGPSDSPIINAVYPGIFAGHMFFASLFIRDGSADFRTMKRAVKDREKPESKDTFLLIAEDRLGAPTKLALFTSATIVVLWTLTLDYAQSYWTGFATVVSVAYLLSLLWEVIADFDDPINGAWVIKGIPEEWLKEIKIKPRLSDRILDRLLGTS